MKILTDLYLTILLENYLEIYIYWKNYLKIKY